MSAHARLEVVATDGGERVLVARSGPGPAETDVVARVTPDGFHGSSADLETNARRLAACWNLCLGVPDDALLACAARHSLAARADAFAQAARRHDPTVAHTHVTATRLSTWHG